MKIVFKVCEVTIENVMIAKNVIMHNCLISRPITTGDGVAVTWDTYVDAEQAVKEFIEANPGHDYQIEKHYTS